MRDASTRPRNARSIGGYYDRLGIWTALARPFGYGGGSGQLTVHRLLADPRAGGRVTSTRIHDLIAEALPPLQHPRILDAGCGLGGTILDLAGRYGGTAVGLTLSDTQRRRAEQAVNARGMQGRVDVRVQSYDEPPPGPFDLIVAIESLAHSETPAASVTALSATLAPGGFFVVVDDMPEPGAIGSQDLAAFRHGWKAPVVWSHRDYAAELERLGLTIVVDRDLTADSRMRTLGQIRRLERVNRFLHAAIPSAGWRGVLDSYHGGLALERLYRRGWMRYRLLVATRAAGETKDGRL